MMRFEAVPAGGSFVPAPSYCRSCRVSAFDHDLSRCSSCRSIWYCCRDCQAKDWKIHKKFCKLISSSDVELGYDPLDPHASLFIDPVKEACDREQRMRLGTSEDDEGRENEAALLLNRDGLQAKRAGRIEEAVMLYSLSIELDGYFHHSFHNRCAAYKLLDKWNMVRIDAERCLQLLESFPLGWCNVIQGCYYTLDFEGARKAAAQARIVADRTNPQYHFLPDQIQWLEQELSNPYQYPLAIKPTMNEGDELAFVYTDGLRLRQQQELLVVDVPSSAAILVQQKIIHGLIMTKQVKPGKKLALGKVLKVGAYKILSIPVEGDDQVRAIKWSLLGQRMSGREMKPDEELNPGGVVLLKIYKGKTKVPEITDAEAKAYVDAVVANAGACETLYGEGRRLVEDDTTHVGLA